MTRRMSPGMQEFNIGRMLTGRGIERDAFDISANLDRSLTYRENRRNISDMLGLGGSERDYAGEHYARQTGFTHTEIDRRLLALHPGKRRSHSGRTYYERRANRSDMDRQRRL
jgi:hypothetical protein